MASNVRNYTVSKLYGFVWCKIVDAFQTSAIDAVSDHKLKYLVTLFNLSPDLLSS